MSQLSENTAALQSILEAVNALPDAGGDIECGNITASGDISCNRLNAKLNITTNTAVSCASISANTGNFSNGASIGGIVSASGATVSTGKLTATGEATFKEAATFEKGIAGVTNYPESGVEELTGGTWIDGKPIYRFLWKGTTTHKKSQKVMTNFPNDITPDTVISLTGMLKRSDGQWMPIPNAYYGSADHTANLRTYEGNGIYLGLGDGFDGTKTVVIIAEYTK